MRCSRPRSKGCGSRSSNRRTPVRTSRCAATWPIRTSLRGAHVTVLRRGNTVGAELNLSSDEERRIQQRFGNHVERRFTFESRRVGPSPTSPPDGTDAAYLRRLRPDANARPPMRAAAPEDPATRQPASTRDTASPATASTWNLPWAASSPSTALSPGSPSGRRSSRTRRSTRPTHCEAQFAEAAKLVPWYVVADGHVDRDLDLGALACPHRS